MAVAAVARRGAEIAGKTRIRTRTVHVGSEYRRDVASSTCELCISEWSAAVRDITFEFAATDGSATWETVDAGRLVDARGRTRIALEILEAVEMLDRASAMVGRLDGAYIHNDDWDDEGLPWLTRNSRDGSDARG